MIDKVDEFILYDTVQYTKNDWRNRNRIKTHDGMRWLTIPVRQQNLDQLINETQVTQHNWYKKHFKTWQLNYSKAPFWKRQEEWLKQLYFDGEKENLSLINERFIRWICNKVGIKTKIVRAEHYNYSGKDKNERLLHLLLSADATHYLSGPAAKDYMKVKMFEDAGIEVNWMNYGPYKEYQQLHGDFEHGVSVLDLILQVDPDVAKRYIVAKEQ